MTSDSVWQVPIVVAEIPDAGLHRKIEANADIRKAIAAEAGLHDVTRLEAAFHLKPSGDLLHVTGRVRATVGQTCVVTLDPMNSEIEESIDVMFSENPPAAVPAGEDDDLEYDPPEAIVAGQIDLGALAIEFMILGLDPYPRKPGVVFEPLIAPVDPADHPFAALAALKSGDPPRKSRKSKAK